MTQILDRIAKTLHSAFRPANPDDYFALRLAYRLGEPEAAGHYALLASQYSQEQFVCIYRKVTAGGPSGKPLGRLFHDHLASARPNGHNHSSRPRLLAIRIERRAVAGAVFAGTHLEGRRVLQLSSNPARAEASAAGFIRSLLADSECESAAIEPAPKRADFLRSLVHRTVVEQVRSRSVPVWEVSKQTVFAASAYPGLKSRRQLRHLIQSIWPLPGLKESHYCALDAFALGLFVQTERLFNNL